MTVPVASAPSVRTPRPTGADRDSSGGAPFASALDGALNAGRDQGVPAVTRRSPQSEQRPDRGEHRALGHERADGKAVRQAPCRSARGADAPGQRGVRRVDDHDPARTPSTRSRADRDAAPSTDNPTTPEPADDPATAVDAGIAAAIGAGIPAAWTLPLAVTAPPTATVTDPAAGPTDVAAVVGTPAQSTVALDASGAGATAGLQPVSAGADAGSALPPIDPSAPTAQSPAVLPGDPGAAGASGPATGSTLPAAPGVVLSQPAGPPPSYSDPSAVVAGVADDSAPPVATAPAFPGLPTVTAPAPAWLRAASATGAAADSTPPAPAVDTPADGGNALPDLSSAAVTASGGAGKSPSSDSGDPSGHDPRTGVPNPVAVTGTPPLATAPAVAPVTASTPAAAPHAPVATQVSSQVMALSNGPDGTHSVTVVLHPDSLGPVQVHVTLHQGTVDLTMRGAHEQGRAALMDALPALRRDLEAAGLTCSSLGVDRDTGGSWSAQQQSAQQQAANQQWAEQGRRPQVSPDGQVRPWSRTADSGDSRQVPASTRSTSRGVDVRV